MVGGSPGDAPSFELLDWTSHHAQEHQNGGDDELDVTGLSGVLADDQDAGSFLSIPLETGATKNYHRYVYGDGGFYPIGAFTFGSFCPIEMQLDAASPPQLTAVNNHQALAFDDSTDEIAYCQFIVPVDIVISDFASITIRYCWSMAATTGIVSWKTNFEDMYGNRCALNDYFDSNVTASAAPSGSSHYYVYTDLVAYPSTYNLILPLFGVRLKVWRDANYYEDTAVGDAFLYGVLVYGTWFDPD